MLKDVSIASSADDKFKMFKIVIIDDCKKARLFSKQLYQLNYKLILT